MLTFFFCLCIISEAEERMKKWIVVMLFSLAFPLMAGNLVVTNGFVSVETRGEQGVGLSSDALDSRVVFPVNQGEKLSLLGHYGVFAKVAKLSGEEGWIDKAYLRDQQDDAREKELCKLRETTESNRIAMEKWEAAAKIRKAQEEKDRKLKEAFDKKIAVEIEQRVAAEIQTEKTKQNIAQRVERDVELKAQAAIDKRIAEKVALEMQTEKTRQDIEQRIESEIRKRIAEVGMGGDVTREKEKLSQKKDVSAEAHNAVRGTTILFVWVGFGFCFYFLPTLIASARSHCNTSSILVLNFFLGWSIVGWVAALAWSVALQNTSA